MTLRDAALSAKHAGTGSGSNVRLDLTTPEDRYHRLRLIHWWDHDRLKDARVLVIGAGALGNELLKNLALLGVGRIQVVDFDHIESSNLSRTVLFRQSDVNRPKAEVAARRAMELNPDTHVRAIPGNVTLDIGLGIFRAADVILGALDNREARLWINQSCWRVNRPWIDGAIEVLQGVARVFIPPHGPCYECTMTELDYKILQHRKSCALLSHADVMAGRVPTTPTTASIIAAIQTQEMVKLLHSDRELPVLDGKGYMFNGLTHDSYVVEYPLREDCPSHETFEHVEELPAGVGDVTLRDMLDLARERLGPEAVIEFHREIVTEFTCPRCGTSEPVFRQLGRLKFHDARCDTCGEPRTPRSTHGIDGSEPFLSRTLAEIDVPPMDIVTARVGFDMVHFELSGDRERALGPNW